MLSAAFCICAFAEGADTLAPVISGIEDGRTYCYLPSFAVSDDGDGDLTVYLNGTELFPYHDRYDIKTTGSCVIRAVDGAGNEETVTVYIKDTHTYESGNPASVIWLWDGNNDACLTLICIYCGHSLTPSVSVSKESGNRYDIYTAAATGDDRNTYIDTKTVEKQTAQTPVPPTAAPEPSAAATPIPQITLAPEPTPVWTDELWFDGEYYAAEYLPEQADLYLNGALSSPEPSASPEPSPEPEEESRFTLSLPPRGNLIIKTGDAYQKEGSAREETTEQGSGLELREANIRTLKCLALALAVCICIVIIIKINIGEKTQKKSEKSAKND
ncbi:MAG: hypothetical protein IJL40_06100 [Oscillospiraceae bacterium]|nr:hypothetical protein [Oscillospiraceae bacterium]MBQ6214030.1 hypothetical protein [Oscillospiraceae bacterium]